MPRATWSGNISFGMVHIPAKLYTATDADAQIEFNQLNSKTGNRIKQKRVDAVTGEPVAFEDIVKGYEIEKGKYVQVTDEELDTIAPDKTSTIEIVGFVDPSSIDPIYLDKPYYLGSGQDVNKPYSLLKAAMEKTGKVAVAKFTMRTKQYTCLIRPTEHGLVASTLRYHEEIRDPKTVQTPDIPLTEREVQMAVSLVDSLSEEIEIKDFKDEHRAKVMSMIEAKASGIPVSKVVTPTTQPTTDLLAALEASVAAAKQKRQAS